MIDFMTQKNMLIKLERLLGKLYAWVAVRKIWILLHAYL